MKKHKYILLVILSSQMFFNQMLAAKSHTYIQGGANISFLCKENTREKPGIYIGVGKDFFPFRLNRGAFNISLGYLEKKLTIPNKSWPSNMEPEWSDARVGDIPLDRSYFELCTTVGYNIGSFKNVDAVKIFTGPSISYAIKYLERLRADRTIFLEPSERGDYAFDYLRCEKSSNLSSSWTASISVEIKHWGLMLRYDKNLSSEKCIRGLTIDDSIDSVHLLTRYFF